MAMILHQVMHVWISKSRSPLNKVNGFFYALNSNSQVKTGKSMNRSDITWNHLQQVRKNAPLVHNITNYVVMNNTANALLALGASPVMAHAKEEVTDMVSIAGSLVINIGTLSPRWVEAMEMAMNAAKKKGIPIIFDPVGAGATPYRTQTVKDLMNSNHPDIIRGNASEIIALYSAEARTKGVDSTEESDTAREAAQFLSDKYQSVVVVSGKVDYIFKGKEERQVRSGAELMTRVTGMGCTASALVGAFAAVIDKPDEAAESAMRVMGIAGELAADKADGPGTLQLFFLDALYTMDKTHIGIKLSDEQM
jgi:hydroxyethylthiazole kinase